MAKKQEEFHAILNVIGEKSIDKPELLKNYPRYKEAKAAILTITDIIWEADKDAKIHVVEEGGTALTLHIESPLLTTLDLERLCRALDKATRLEVFPAAGGIGVCIIFDGVFIKS